MSDISMDYSPPGVIVEWREKLLTAAKENNLENVTCILDNVGEEYCINVLETALDYGDDLYHENSHILKFIIDTLLEAQIKREEIAEAIMQCYYCPLYRYVYDGMDLEIFEKMIEKGADVNKLDEYSNSALYYAIEKRLDKICAILVRSGADINLSENDWRDQIHLTSLQVLNALVTNGANVNCVDKYGDTLLKTLMMSRDEICFFYKFYEYDDCYTEDFILCLLENGAHLNLGKECKCVAKHGSPDRLLSDAIDHLIDCEMTSDERYIYWHRATQFGWLQLTKSFLQRDIDMNRRDKRGFTPLHNMMGYWIQTGPVSPKEKLERLANVLRLNLDDCADVSAKVSSDSWMHPEAHRRCLRYDRCNGECTILHVATWQVSRGFDTKCTEECRMMVNPIIEKIARLSYHDKFVNLADLEIIEEYDDLDSYYRNCIRELESMKTRRFYRNITLSDVLDDDIMQHLGKLQISHLIESYMGDEQRDEFPIYSKTLLHKFERILQSQRLSRQASIILNDIFDSVLPIELIMYNLIVHFSLNDIKVITRGYKE